MIISPSSSFPDLNAHSSKISTPTTNYRIPRKPAPSIDIDIINSERYPSPDPLDPFAPLWVLRNRTSSALHGISPYSGPYGSQETLANLVEDERRRRRSYSYNLLSSPYSGGDTGSTVLLQPNVLVLGDTDNLSHTSISSSVANSPLGSPVKATTGSTEPEQPNTKSISKTPKSSNAKAKVPPKKGHYTPYSQTQAHTRASTPSPAAATTPGATLLQAFPRLSTSTLLPAHFQAPSPSDNKQNHHRVHRASYAALNSIFHNSNDNSGSSGTSDAETDSNSDTYTNSNSNSKAYITPTESSPQLKPVLSLVRPHTSGESGSPGNASGWWFSRSKSSNDPLASSKEKEDERHHHQRRAQSVLGLTSTSMLAHSTNTKTTQHHGPGQGTAGRFTKFLLPRKISFLRNGGGGGGKNQSNNNRRPSTADRLDDDNSGSKPHSRRSRSKQRPVSKASISSPQAVMSTTVFWDHGCSRTLSCARPGDNNNDDLCSRGSSIMPVPVPATTTTTTTTMDDDDGLDVPVAVAQRQRSLGDEMKTTNMTNRMNDMTNATNITNNNMNATGLDWDHDDNDVSISGSVSKSSASGALDGPESNTHYSATEKKCNDGDSDYPGSPRSYSTRVLHPLTISELTDQPISDDANEYDDDGRLIVVGCASDTAIEPRRRYSLDIIDGYGGATRRAVVPPTQTSTSTSSFTQQLQRMLDDGTGSGSGDNSTPTAPRPPTNAAGKKRTTSFFRVMARTMKPSGPRPNMTEGRLQALTAKPESDLHVGTPTSTPTPTPTTTAAVQMTSSPVLAQRRPSAISTLTATTSTPTSVSTPSMLASMSSPSFASNPSYLSPRRAPQPPTPTIGDNASARGKGKSPFLFMKKNGSGADTMKGDKRRGLGEEAARKRRRRKSGNGSASIVTVERTPTSSLAGIASAPSASKSNAENGDIEVKEIIIASDANNIQTHGSEGFSFPTEWTIPTAPQLTFAASLPLTCEDGTHISFGSLFASTRTIVVFIRHFWCPLCQDYMSSLKSLVRPEMLATWPRDATAEEEEELRKRLVKFVVVSNGAHGMIGKYRKIFGLPFKVYTDPELRVYRALGMGRDGGEVESCGRHPRDENDHDGCSEDRCRGTVMDVQRNHSFYHYQQEQQRMRQKPLDGGVGVEDEKKNEVVEVETEKEGRRCSGGYVKHGLVGGIAMVVVRAIKVGMPVWEKGGDVGQLGGEFIFGPGLKCTYAHRMQTTRGHAPIEDVLTAAGIDVSSLSVFSPSSLSPEIAISNQPFGPVKLGEGEVLASASVVINDLHSLPARKGPLSSSIEVGADHPRRRLSSLRNLRGSISLSRVASAISVSLIQKSLHGSAGVGVGGVVVTPSNLAEGVVEQIQSKRHTRRYSLGFEGVNGVVMGRDEEEKWMESRQASIERLREKKDMRRGILRSRATSPDSSSAAAPAEAVDEVVIQPERWSTDLAVKPINERTSSLPLVMVEKPDEQLQEEDDEMTPTVTRRPLSTHADEDWDSSDGEAEAEVDDDDCEESDRESTPNPSLISQRSLESLSDTASSWSRSTAPPHDGGSYVFMHDVVL